MSGSHNDSKSQKEFPTSSFVINNYEGQVALQNYTAAITADVYGNGPARKPATAKDNLKEAIKPPTNG
jgi:hypothetical protein